MLLRSVGLPLCVVVLLPCLARLLIRVVALFLRLAPLGPWVAVLFLCGAAVDKPRVVAPSPKPALMFRVARLIHCVVRMVFLLAWMLPHLAGPSLRLPGLPRWSSRARPVLGCTRLPVLVVWLGWRGPTPLGPHLGGLARPTPPPRLPPGRRRSMASRLLLA